MKSNPSYSPVSLQPIKRPRKQIMKLLFQAFHKAHKSVSSSIKKIKFINQKQKKSTTVKELGTINKKTPKNRTK